MKKLLTCAVLIATLIFPTASFATSGFKLNDKIVNKPIEVKFGEKRELFLTIDQIVEELGYTIKVDEQTKKVSITDGKDISEFYLEGANPKDSKIPILPGTKMFNKEVMVPSSTVFSLFNKVSITVTGSEISIEASRPIKQIQVKNQEKSLTSEEKIKNTKLKRGYVTKLYVDKDNDTSSNYIEVKSGNEYIRFILLGIKPKVTTTQKDVDKFMKNHVNKELKFIIDYSYTGIAYGLSTAHAGYLYDDDKMLNLELIKSGLYEINENHNDIIYFDELKAGVAPTTTIINQSTAQPTTTNQPSE